MAPLAKSLALAGSLFAAFAAAAPVNKRGNVVVYETATTVVWTTVDVTTTVYGAQPTTEAPAPPPTTVVSVTHAVPTETPEPTQPEETQPVETQPASSAPTTTAAPTTVAPAPQPTVPAQEPTTLGDPGHHYRCSHHLLLHHSPSSVELVRHLPLVVVAAAAAADYSGACSKESPCTSQVTFYDTATSASAPSSCGYTNDGETENVLALPVGIMKDSDCGRTVTIKYGGSTKTGKVVDKCMGCDSTSIDLSRHFFSELAAFAEGRLFGVEWWMELPLSARTIQHRHCPSVDSVVPDDIRGRLI
ncbi:allergen Asp f 7 [Aspergillus terreus NIH2624]|uniref:Allergen Asp f 7 n=1 Tax=Aspergillus terreus (strain NIH 2624 / FGSC A1156) TaxID=341663 RepID=Q0CL73_ASPTN|nr:allergen Asp f 7 [Aspergillus terreus NIH2624]EAU34630.1 allergen Asp f 7 [Aspergillus terreus NIH2624]